MPHRNCQPSLSQRRYGPPVGRGALTRHGVPQALDYLIRDGERRHGRVRIGAGGQAVLQRIGGQRGARGADLARRLTLSA